MAFSTRRGRPPQARASHTDSGTPELRLKHALGLTCEPIDLCLARAVITPEQHWSGLHLRWLYTLRYGAPVITTRYTDRVDGTAIEQDALEWRAMREHEYLEVIAKLHASRYYETVMRLCVFNELPAFLNRSLADRALKKPQLADELERSRHLLYEGLDMLVQQWRRRPISSLLYPEKMA